MADLVSVVIPTYERNELLFGRALPSVLNQTYKKLEIHIVADGMRGESLGELMWRGHNIDPRVRVWNIPRQEYPTDPGQRWMVLGLNARNHGLDQCEGKWIAPLDDDDEWELDHVEVLLKHQEESGAGFVYGQSKYHWPDGRTQYAGTWPPGMGAFCDGAQLYRNGMGFRYDPACIDRGLPEDGDLWTRMVKGGVSFSLLQRVVHHYYPNPR